MARLNNECRRRVVTLYSRGHSVTEIRKRLQEENILISRQSLYNLINKFRKGTPVADGQLRRRKRKITKEMETMIDQALRNNDEITSTGLRDMLAVRYPELQVSIPTIKRVRREIGWVCTRPHYCQLLRPVS